MSDYYRNSLISLYAQRDRELRDIEREGKRLNLVAWIGGIAIFLIPVIFALLDYLQVPVPGSSR